MQAEETGSLEERIHRFCADRYDDPYGFVCDAYPWPINGEPGPDRWQAEILKDIGRQVKARAFDGTHTVLPIRLAISSGHGIGKGALWAWIVDWIMSTRPHAKGTVTANTATQLDNKTWAAIRFWTKLCLTRNWWEINSTIMYRRGFRESWFCAPQSSKEENSEAFAGQHALGTTSFYIFDEASAIAEKIWEVAEGGLSDGEPMMLVGGNATRNTGRFHEVCFGAKRDRWNPHIIDSRTCKLPNKELIKEWESDYGEDSDFFRVRVRGLPPRASDLQFIDLERVWLAQKREPVTTFKEDALIAGVDVSGGGAAWNVVRFRRGMDARSIPPIRIPGEKTRHDRSAFLAILAGLLRETHPDRRVHMMFIDSAFGAPYAVLLKTMGFANVMEVNNGAESPDKHQLNMRAYCWQKGKDWLLTGAIPSNDTRLESDFTAPGFHLNAKQQLVIESKESMAKRGVASPDDADAHMLTFAAPVIIDQSAAGIDPTPPAGGSWQG